MRRVATVLLLCAVCVSASPATAPVDSPAAVASAAAGRLAAARAAALQSFAATREHKEAARALDVADQDLAIARASGTSAEKLSASAARNRAAATLKRLEAAAVDGDPDVRAASRTLESARASLKEAEAEADKRAAAALAKQQEAAKQKTSAPTEEGIHSNYDKFKDATNVQLFLVHGDGASGLTVLSILYEFPGTVQDAAAEKIMISAAYAIRREADVDAPQVLEIIVDDFRQKIEFTRSTTAGHTHAVAAAKVGWQVLAPWRTAKVVDLRVPNRDEMLLTESELALLRQFLAQSQKAS